MLAFGMTATGESQSPRAKSPWAFFVGRGDLLPGAEDERSRPVSPAPLLSVRTMPVRNSEHVWPAGLPAALVDASPRRASTPAKPRQKISRLLEFRAAIRYYGYRPLGGVSEMTVSMRRVTASAPLLASKSDGQLEGESVPRASLLREVYWTVAAGLITAAMAAAMISWLPKPLYRDDCQSEILPAYVDMDRALGEGSFPLLSPYSWCGGNLAGEYQYAVFSAAHLLIITAVFRCGLSLAHSAAAIAVIYLAIAGSGAFRLGRRYGLGVPAALYRLPGRGIERLEYLLGSTDLDPMFGKFLLGPLGLVGPADCPRWPLRGAAILAGRLVHLLAACGGRAVLRVDGRHGERLAGPEKRRRDQSSSVLAHRRRLGIGDSVGGPGTLDVHRVLSFQQPPPLEFRKPTCGACRLAHARNDISPHPGPLVGL